MNREEFRRLLEQKLLPGESLENLQKVTWMYDLAKLFHRGQARDSGERYFEHPRAVALILMDEFSQGHTTAYQVMLALGHDVLEDCYPPQGMISELFGLQFSYDLSLLSKYNLSYEASGKIQRLKKSVEEYRRGIIGGPYPVRRTKLADRLHNLRSLERLGEKRQRKQVGETREWILPVGWYTDRRMAAALDDQCLKLEASWSK